MSGYLLLIGGAFEEPDLEADRGPDGFVDAVRFEEARALMAIVSSEAIERARLYQVTGETVNGRSET